MRRLGLQRGLCKVLMRPHDGAYLLHATDHVCTASERLKGLPGAPRIPDSIWQLNNKRKHSKEQVLAKVNKKFRHQVEQGLLRIALNLTIEELEKFIK